MTSCTRAYKFRLYSSNEQRVLIHKTFGCYRFIYNYFLDKCKTNCYMKAYDICIFLKGLYYEFPFLKEEDSCSLRCAIFNLEDSYKRFFFKKTRYPKFKNKYTKQTYRTNCIRSTYKERTYSNIFLDLVNNIIKLPKLDLVKIRGYRNLEIINGNIINATVERDITNKYYVSVVIEKKNLYLKK